jgi:hypothetical protein
MIEDSRVENWASDNKFNHLNTNRKIERKKRATILQKKIANK